MARTAVADGAVVTPFDLYHVTDVNAVTAVPAGDVRAFDHVPVVRRARQGAPVADEWEYLAEGFAWVLDACD